jgi:phenylacetyl-CoA:acceptor oxidoreductase
LPPGRRPESEEVWDSMCKAASYDLTGGEQVNDLEWFKEHGYMLGDFKQIDWYLYPALKRQNLRFELPYQERLTRHGHELAVRMKEMGVEWWETQLREYEFMPTYESFPEIWTDYVRDFGADPDDYPFWGLTARSFQYAWGANVGLPIINEVANNVAGHKGIIINRTRAKEMGIAEGEAVVIESVSGVTEGNAVLREGIRPDTVLMIGQFDHWKTPYAKDLNLPSLNSVTDISLKLTDSSGSSADLVRLKIYKASERHLHDKPSIVSQTKAGDDIANISFGQAAE